MCLFVCFSVPSKFILCLFVWSFYIFVCFSVSCYVLSYFSFLFVCFSVSCYLLSYFSLLFIYFLCSNACYFTPTLLFFRSEVGSCPWSVVVWQWSCCYYQHFLPHVWHSWNILRDVSGHGPAGLQNRRIGRRYKHITIDSSAINCSPPSPKLHPVP